MVLIIRFFHLLFQYYQGSWGFLSPDFFFSFFLFSVQQSNDSCLAYTLTAICNLLSEIGISSTSGILGSSLSPVTSIGTSLSIQQQLFVLLSRSLKRAETLKLKRLVASNHLAMAKFGLTVWKWMTSCWYCLCWVLF